MCDGLAVSAIGTGSVRRSNSPRRSDSASRSNFASRSSRSIPRGAALAALAAAVAGVVYLRRSFWSFTDLGVYRAGAAAVLDGRSLYGDRPGLPFTYPPFAADVFVPLQLVGRPVAISLMLVVSGGAYVAFCVVVAHRLGLDRFRTAVVVVAGVALEPMWHTLALGQINIILAALVALDALVVGDRHRGWLVGVAAGIKLVPAVFVVYFVLRHDWRAAARSGLGLLGTILVGAVTSPHDTWRYWTVLFYKPDHVGGLAYVGNQSLNGDLIRLLRDEHPPTLVYAATVVAALGLAVVGARRQLRRENEVAALTCIAVGGLLVSPVSWTHHWVWLLPAALVLAARRDWAPATFIAGVCVVAPMWLVPATHLREFHHNAVQAGCCLAYAAAAIWFLARMADQR